ncbi:AraC family transcriptional regulator [uncultured Polaribacter sp.]|uniref:helix-turn-helix domain-containing protein n=1 Tax=uncultured Polaribacter sp. TaxID=174711 RepID=UPI0026046EFC|nr:helix-turn-helix domain-containing protein [uncultured Polaribacter sp.]
MFKLILLSIAIFQGIIVGVILLTSPFFKSKVNKFLAFALFSISFSLLKISLDITQIFEIYPFLRFIEVIDSEALLPVFVFLFIAYQVNNAKLNFRKTFWLFIPALISTLGFGYLEFGLNNGVSEEISLYNIVVAISILIVLLIFYPYILYKTYKVLQFSKNKQEKKWFIYLWSFEIFILGSLMLVVILAPFIVNEILNILQILALFSTLLVHWIAYTGVYKLKLINDRSKIRKLINHTKTESISTNIFESSEHPIETKEQILISQDNNYYKKLEHLCSVQQIYRDSSLDRNSVANILGISPSYVSQIINSITGENFSTYINRYRVEEVKRLILNKEYENYSLLAIGLECGFSSKTTFHNSFKKITGMTPNTYRKKHQ